MFSVSQLLMLVTLNEHTFSESLNTKAIKIQKARDTVPLHIFR